MGFPPKSLVTLGEDLKWWAEDAALARYLQILSPQLGITPSEPSRVMEVYQAVRVLVPTLTSVGVEHYDDPKVVAGVVY